MIYTIEKYNCYNLTCDNVASIVSIIMRICGIYYITNIINQIKYVSKETCEKQSKALKGLKRTPEQCERIRQGQLNRYINTPKVPLAEQVFSFD
jgi:hypothetical protein